MRDSINYNLNYFIMRMSGIKPIKNTVRKSPIKQDAANNAGEAKVKSKVTNTANSKGGTGVKSKRAAIAAKISKSVDAKNNSQKSAAAVAKNKASKAAMDKYVNTYNQSKP
jgi:hypothetical protein